MFNIIVDERTRFPTNPDTSEHLQTTQEPAPSLFLAHLDTPDEIDPFSAQVRRGLNCARRGLEGLAAVPAGMLVDARMRPGRTTAAHARRITGLRLAGVH